MACPVVISVDQSLHFGVSQVGTQGITFGKLFAEGIPIPEIAIIPTETLYRLSQENHLFTQISQANPLSSGGTPANRQKFKKEIHTIITTQKLPSWFLKEVLHVYHRKFINNFVQIVPGIPFPQFEASHYMQIEGEANLLESLLQAWAELIFLEVEKQPHIRPIHIAPTPIILQSQQQPVISGIGFTAHPNTLSKSQVLIKSIWGAPDSNLIHEESDSYTVDVRTWHIVEQVIAQKTKQLRREPDSVVSLKLSDHYRDAATLTEEQVQAIAQVIFSIKQKRLGHQIVSWELSKEGLVVTSLQETELAETRASGVKKTSTKLYISTGNPSKHLPQLLPQVEGIGVMRSEYTLAKFGIHPLHVIQSKQKYQLVHAMVSTIQAYQQAMHLKPIIYRSQNFTSSELRQLRFSENYEPAETNPYLGYRGGLQLLRQPELLQFELEVLETALERSQSSLGFMPSFVRTSQELEFIIAQIEKKGLFTKPHFSLWLQLNTPENIMNLRSYPTHKLAGISVNVKSLHALLLGIDPDNPEISEHYAVDTIVIERYMEQLAQTVEELQSLRNFTQPLHVHLHLEEYSHDLVALAVKLGYHAITVKPAAAQIAHAAIVETEEKQLAFLQ